MTDDGHQVIAKTHIAFVNFKSIYIVEYYSLNRNLVGSIYGMSSMKIAHFVPIG
jgi:hypothetical protein